MPLIPELFILLDQAHKMCLCVPLLGLNLSQHLKVHCQDKFCSLSKLSGITQNQYKQDANLNGNLREFKWPSKLYIHIIGAVQDPFYLKWIRISC